MHKYVHLYAHTSTCAMDAPHTIHTELQYSRSFHWNYSLARTVFVRTQVNCHYECVCARSVKMKMDVTIQLNSHSNDPVESVFYYLNTLFSLFIDETVIMRPIYWIVRWVIQKTLPIRFDSFLIVLIWAMIDRKHQYLDTVEVKW